MLPMVMLGRSRICSVCDNTAYWAARTSAAECDMSVFSGEINGLTAASDIFWSSIIVWERIGVYPELTILNKRIQQVSEFAFFNFDPK